jgi:mono/diheme cytochrome c family protein
MHCWQTRLPCEQKGSANFQLFSTTTGACIDWRRVIGEGDPVKGERVYGSRRDASSVLRFLTFAAVLLLPGVSHAADEAAGQKAWSKTCKECHNMPTEGGQGPKLIPLEHTADQIRDIVRFGNGEMKALATSSISDADLDNVIAYLESLDKKGK